MIMGMLLGAGAACLLWVCIMVPWSIIANQRDDRRFNALVKGMDAGRDKAWRELGVSEEKIALYYRRRAEYMKDPWRTNDNEPRGM